MTVQASRILSSPPSDTSPLGALDRNQNERTGNPTILLMKESLRESLTGSSQNRHADQPGPGKIRKLLTSVGEHRKLALALAGVTVMAGVMGLVGVLKNPVFPDARSGSDEMLRLGGFAGRYEPLMLERECKNELFAIVTRTVFEPMAAKIAEAAGFRHASLAEWSSDADFNRGFIDGQTEGNRQLAECLSTLNALKSGALEAPVVEPYVLS